ncbi:hypothetical protein CAPGI0001_2073 [Capnocytophaga gingivalis ATCC 33624]|nr:hypothetical protein CAPGI0001_2073 [Capnocytophaga gingivalis ATCC 33624]
MTTNIILFLLNLHDKRTFSHFFRKRAVRNVSVGGRTFE